MSSFKEPHAARSQSQHRLSMSSTPSLNVPSRHSNSRHHSHSLSLGTMNSAHRVTRRKSMTSTAASNLAAMAAAMKGNDEFGSGTLASHRRSLPSKANGLGNGTTSMERNMNGSLNEALDTANHFRNAEADLDYENAMESVDIAIRDGPSLADTASNNTKPRGRRASEGSHLTKGEGKRASGELRCEKCGKGYKHSSCLTKHLWEHTPEWSYTSKLLISKHQQVQLLEAASVLVTMNQDLSAPPESVKASDSDHSSSSPAAFPSFDLQDDDISSVETTPPPMSEEASVVDHMENAKRYSSNSSVFSRSYPSAPSGSVLASSIPTGTSFGSYHQQYQYRRPSASGIGSTGMSGPGEDEAGLAAAVELCNFGTPRTGPIHLPQDIPPVPPLPAQYALSNTNRSSVTTKTPSLSHGLGIPPPLTHRLSDERDVKMQEGRQTRVFDEEDSYERSISRGRSDEDDDGIFGRMEE